MTSIYVKNTLHNIRDTTEHQSNTCLRIITLYVIYIDRLIAKWMHSNFVRNNVYNQGRS
jgi:hypothetical protein